MDSTPDQRMPAPVMKTVTQPKPEDGVWVTVYGKKKVVPQSPAPRATVGKSVAYALSSEFCPGCRDNPAQRGGGGVDPDRLFSNVVQGLKRRAQGVCPA